MLSRSVFRPGLIALSVCLVAGFGVLTPVARAASCLTQATMPVQERGALVAAARGMLVQVQNGDVNGLRANTLPAVAADFSGIAQSVQTLSPDVKMATVTVEAVYDLDSSTDAAGAQSTQFYCGSSPVVVLNFAGLPPGKYALALTHATGVEKPQQVSLILAQNGGQWQLAGFFVKPMVTAGHDGLWYWVSARKYKQMNGRWAAWIYYRRAEDLLSPLDNLSSPNMEKLRQETDEVKPGDFPTDKPVTVNRRGDFSGDGGGYDDGVWRAGSGGALCAGSGTGGGAAGSADGAEAGGGCDDGAAGYASGVERGVPRDLGACGSGECELVCAGAADGSDWHRR